MGGLEESLTESVAWGGKGCLILCGLKRTTGSELKGGGRPKLAGLLLNFLDLRPFWP
jgi:hypothetical protein